jgi:hypothetical protein
LPGLAAWRGHFGIGQYAKIAVKNAGQVGWARRHIAAAPKITVKNGIRPFDAALEQVGTAPDQRGNFDVGRVGTKHRRFVGLFNAATAANCPMRASHWESRHVGFYDYKFSSQNILCHIAR